MSFRQSGDEIFPLKPRTYSSFIVGICSVVNELRIDVASNLLLYPTDSSSIIANLHGRKALAHINGEKFTKLGFGALRTDL